MLLVHWWKINCELQGHSTQGMVMSSLIHIISQKTSEMESLTINYHKIHSNTQNTPQKHKLPQILWYTTKYQMRCVVPYDCWEDINVFVAVDQNWDQVFLDHLEKRLQSWLTSENAMLETSWKDILSLRTEKLTNLWECEGSSVTSHCFVLLC